MKRKTAICLSVILTFSLFLFVKCNNSKEKKVKVTNIGIILPLSGEVATYGKSVQKGLEIAFEISKNKRYRPIYEDSKAEKKTAISALEKLFFDEVNFFIGDATSTVTYEIGPRIQAKNGILIVPIATGDKIRETGKNIFMISPRNEKQTQKIVSFIKENFSGKKIGCIFKQNEYGVNIANTFLKLLDVDIFSQAYQEGQSDFRSSLLKFKTAEIAIVFLPGNYKETAVILKQAKEIGYNTTFIGTDGAYSPKLIEQAKESSEGFLLTMMPVNYTSEFYLNFERIYKEKYNEKPDIFSCYGYESGHIMINAINSSTTTDEVRNYLKSHEFDSLTGKMRFINEGDPKRPGWEADRDYKVYVVKDGNFIPYLR